MREVVYISAGAIAGANARYFFERWVTTRLGNHLSWGILFINVLGSLLVGCFVGFVAARASGGASASVIVTIDPRWRLLLVIGFAGSFTTFSTYAFESVQYLRQGMWSEFATNVILNNLLCMLAVGAGWGLARALALGASHV